MALLSRCICQGAVLSAEDGSVHLINDRTNCIFAKINVTFLDTLQLCPHTRSFLYILNCARTPAYVAFLHVCGLYKQEPMQLGGKKKKKKKKCSFKLHILFYDSGNFV